MSQHSTGKRAETRRTVLKTTGVLGATGITGLAGCSGSSAKSRDTFKFGVVTSLSGHLRYGGKVTKRGYELWKQTINENGGIKVGDSRHKVEFVYADAKSKPSVATSATRKLISNNGVDAILGPYSSRIPLAIGPVLDKTKTPCITGSSESPEIWKQKFKYLFGTIPSVNIYIQQVAENIANLKPEAKSAYITGVNGPFSKAAAEGFRNGMENAGVDIAGFSLYPLEADRSSIVSEAKSANPDLHLNTGNIDSNVKFMQAAKQAGYSPDGIGQHYGINTPGYKNLGSDAKYTLGASMWLPQAGRSGGALWGDSQTFAKQFKNAYGQSPDYTEAASSATGVVYQQALAELGSKPPLSESDKTKLIDILENISVNTFWGEINYKASGANYHNNIQTNPLTIQLNKDLNAKIINPASASNYEPEYPMPDWEER